MVCMNIGNFIQRQGLRKHYTACPFLFVKSLYYIIITIGMLFEEWSIIWP